MKTLSLSENLLTGSKISYLNINTLIPLYLDNGMPERNLRTCLESIANQTRKPSQVIVSDDSSVSHEDLLSRYAAELDLEIQYFRNPSKSSMASNSNFALRKVTAGVVHILHSDDFILRSDFYNDLAQIDFSISKWVLVAGSTGKSVQVPDIKSMNILGLNSIGGPSCLIARVQNYSDYDEQLRLLVDLEHFSRMMRELGEPYVMHVPSIEYGSGDWQVQRSVEFSTIAKEVKIILSKNDVRCDFQQLYLSSLPISHKFAVLFAAQSLREFGIFHALTYFPLIIYSSTLQLFHSIKSICSSKLKYLGVNRGEVRP
jgi:hypothetical protein